MLTQSLWAYTIKDSIQNQWNCSVLLENKGAIRNKRRECSKLQWPNSTEKFSESTSQANQNINEDKSLAGGVSTASPAENMIQKEEEKLNDESPKHHVCNIWSIISY